MNMYTYNPNYKLDLGNLPNLNAKFDFTGEQVKLPVTNGTKGKTIIVDPTSSNSKDQNTYDFLQFHFHSPSEHTIDGKYYDAEVHFVHQNHVDNTSLLVVGVFFDTDSMYWEPSLDFFSPFQFEKWEAWEKNSNEETAVTVDISKFMTGLDSHLFYNYKGSLTTPPCTEAVNWFVMSEVQWINPDTLSYLQKVFQRTTN